MGLYELMPEDHPIRVAIARGDNHEYTGKRWQNQFAEFLVENNAQVVVETGVSTGVSTDRILSAMEKTGGVLYSCEPFPQYGILNFQHPNWRPLDMTSLKGLQVVYKEAGPFDAFVHDSDHGYECQTFEYHAAWGLVKASAWVCSDDYTWDNHGAWQKFMSDKTKFANGSRGACVYVQKPADAPNPPRTDEYLADVIDRAYRMSYGRAG